MDTHDVEIKVLNTMNSAKLKIHVMRLFAKLRLIPALLISLVQIGNAQNTQTLRLQDCYSMARIQYPLSRQRDLIEKTKEYSVANLTKNWYPQFGVFGQVTYQSEVTQVPISIPGKEIPVLDKDQYKVYGEVNQVLFDGGVSGIQKKIQVSNSEAENQKLEVELYKLKDRINQLFFGILMLEEQLKLKDLLKKDLQTGMDKIQAAIDNGTALISNRDVLKAEMLKVDQQRLELLSARKAYLNMLGIFINLPLPGQTLLERPVEIGTSTEIKRPELVWYNSQTRVLDAQQKLLQAKNLPRFNLFVQAGFGKPALNMLSNDFKFYYMGGVRLQWNLSGWYTFKKEQFILDMNRQGVALQQEGFLFNTRLTLQQQEEEISKMKSLLLIDDEIIHLRERIRQTAAVQLENGVISSNDFLKEVNALDAARENKVIHDLQGLMSNYNLQTTTGN